MGCGIQAFQMSGDAGDWIKEATDSTVMFSRQSPMPNTWEVDVSRSLTWNSNMDRITGNANETGLSEMQYQNKNAKDQGNSLQHPRETAAGVRFSCMESPYKGQRKIKLKWCSTGLPDGHVQTEMLNNFDWHSLEQRIADVFVSFIRLCMV